MKRYVIRGRGIEVYEYIRDHPNTTLKKMRRVFEFDERTLRRWVIRLRENNIISAHRAYGTAAKFYKVKRRKGIKLEIQEDYRRTGWNESTYIENIRKSRKWTKVRN